MSGAYEKVYQQSIESPNAFWKAAADDIFWYQSPETILDDSNSPFNTWYKDGLTNACYNALDFHIEQGRGEQTALIYDSPVTQTVKKYTYNELHIAVAQAAGALAELGVTKGDRVIIYMPMIPEAAIAMLACARIGAPHSVVFGGFAANELAVRIDDAQPKLIISASCGIEVDRIIEYKPLLDHAIELAQHKPDQCLIFQRPQTTAALQAGRDFDWVSTVSHAQPVDCVPVESTHPLYILYTSGTTGQPKGVVRDTGGNIVSLKWSMKNIYDVEAGDVFWAASDIGWVVGHAYIVYGPLYNGNTTIMFEGKPVGTPDPGTFWRIISEHQVKSFFTAPTAFRAIKKEDPNGLFIKKYDIQCLKYLFLAGERCDPDTLHWAENQLGIPVIDHWWQTETGWSICANPVGIELLSVRPGSPTKAVPGYQINILDADHQPLPPGEIGDIVVKLPLPPGTFPTLWNAEDRYVNTYFAPHPGYYQTGDAGYIDEEGYLYVMSRTDDVINVAGHRLSTGAMEEVLAAHPDVAECAVIGVADDMKGQVPLGLLVLKAGVTKDDQVIAQEVVKMVRETIGPVAAFKTATVVQRLPKTRSGKVLRGTMRSIADSQPYKTPATIDDPVILDEILDTLKTLGYAKN
ncbi:MAG TPA: propionyl-CoA synthetase [Gammaproteobacteria bacterium]|nr:propionyl-CoA synthetase [Gammaproteobacteria bacterium]